MFKKILVTGGDGFIGRYLVRELLKTEDKIFVLREPSNNAPIINAIDYLYGDITNKEVLVPLLKDIDVVYHLAGNTRTSKTDSPELHNKINASGTRNLLEAGKINKIKRFIFVSSVEVYGIEEEKINELVPPHPINDYGKSKLIAEEFCQYYSKFFKTTIIRPSYVYGYGQPSERGLSRIINSAANDAEINFSPSRTGNDFIYVKDAVKAIKNLGLKNQRKNFDVFNLSSGEFIDMIEIFNLLNKITGKGYVSVDLLPIEKKISYDVSKLKNFMNYSQEFSLEKGMKEWITYEKK